MNSARGNRERIERGDYESRANSSAEEGIDNIVGLDRNHREQIESRQRIGGKIRTEYEIGLNTARAQRKSTPKSGETSKSLGEQTECRHQDGVKCVPQR